MSDFVFDHKDIWNKCLEIIKEEISEKNFQTWFLPIVPYSLKNSTITIEVPNKFFYEWLEENYLPVIKKSITEVLGKNFKLEYCFSGTGSKKVENKNYSKKKVDDYILDYSINNRYNFDNFIEGNCNSMVKSVAQSIVFSLGKSSLNPFILYGNIGMGKTHLVQAIANKVMENDENKKISFISSEMFTNQYIMSIKENKSHIFSKKFLDIDLLIIDDIQFFAGKEKTQEAFFHIFNFLHQKGKQLIMTSDTPPKDMKGLQDRLLSRFKWGLIAKIQDPNFDTKKKIVSKFLQDHKSKFNIDSIDFISSLNINIRELEGMLNYLVMELNVINQKIDVCFVKKIYNNLVSTKSFEDLSDKNSIIKSSSIDTILNCVSDFYKIDPEKIKSSTREKKIALARKIVIHIARKNTSFSLKTIGNFLGKKQHSTVIHSVNSIDFLIKNDLNFKKNYEIILNNLN
jgi:chromosomal replication initiator protein